MDIPEEEVQLPEIVDTECALIDRMISIKVKMAMLMGLYTDPDVVEYYKKFNY